MKRSKIVFVILLAALAWTGRVTGQELDGTLKKIKASSTFNLGYRESAPPFSFPGPDRRPVGYSVELCMHIASAIQKQLGLANLKLNWVPVSAENRIDMVVQGKIDLECGTTTATLSRQERVDFSLMTFVDGGSLLTKADIDLRGVGDLAGKRIAVIPGTTTEAALVKFLKAEFVTVETVRVKDPVEGVEAVEKGTAHAFASDRGLLIGIAVTSKDPKRFGLANVLFSYEPMALCCAAMTPRSDWQSTERWPSSIVRQTWRPFTTAGSAASASPRRRFKRCTCSTGCPSNVEFL
jgi:ABC-type amino acid transport substrate-binding protein